MAKSRIAELFAVAMHCGWVPHPLVESQSKAALRRRGVMGKLNRGNWAYAVLLLCAATTIPSLAQTFTTMHSFDGTDGALPYAGLVQASDGNLYGTTEAFGASGYGTVFKITPSGKLTTMHSFDGTDGAYPYAGLTQAINGNLYGTTYEGGTDNDGTVFKITSNGRLTTLHSFDGRDGSRSTAGLIQATNGDLYGTTLYGGTSGGGSVFKITTGGKLTTLGSFCCNPYAGLVQTTDGNLYGTTEDGGANGYGAVFKITPSGKLTTLHSFRYGLGYDPTAGLAQATDGNFYGTTYEGGSHHLRNGTVFKITPSGKLTTLVNFDVTDGSYPDAELVQATDGNLYGTTLEGGANDHGTVFKITPSGTLTTVYSFCSKSACADGAFPAAGLIQATNGTFYGTTEDGGANGYGAVFSLSVGLGPFVKTRPTSGKVGAAVKILGTDLTGTTSVTFNGTAAVFKVVSPSSINATVPESATTGEVDVTTPNGTLKSNLVFRVTK